MLLPEAVRILYAFLYQENDDAVALSQSTNTKAERSLLSTPSFRGSWKMWALEGE
jgi:hypothetical protein